MKKSFILGLMVFLPVIALGQGDAALNIPPRALSWYDPIKNTDSLKQLLKTAGPQEKADLLCELAYSLLKINPEESFHYTHQALEISDSINYNNGRVKAYMLLASKFNPDDYDTLRAIRYLQKATEHFDEETHWSLKYRIWFGIGQRFLKLNAVDSAFIYFKKPLFELDPDEAWLPQFAAHARLAQQAEYKPEIEIEIKHMEAMTEIIYEHPEISLFLNPQKIFSGLEKLPKYFTKRGMYKESILASQRALDSINSWSFITAAGSMYKAKFHNKIGRAFHFWGYYDSAIKHHNLALAIFDSIRQNHLNDINDPSIYPDFKEWWINVANQLEERAGVLIKKGYLFQAKNDLLESAGIRLANDDPLGVGMTFDKLGEINALQGNYKMALQYYDSALLLKNNFKKAYIKEKGEVQAVFWNSTIMESICYTNLQTGKLYKAWNKDEMALDFFRKSHDLSQTIGYPKGEAEAFTEMGHIYLKMGLPDSARTCYQQTGNIYNRMKNRPGIAIASENMGNLYQALEIPDSARDQYVHALGIFTGLDLPGDRARIFCKVGKIDFDSGNMPEAEHNFLESLKIADMLHLRNIQMECNQILSDLYTILGRVEDAFTHFRQYTSIKDALYTLETNEQIAEIEARFNSEKNRQQITLLEAENQLNRTRIVRTRTILIVIAAFAIIVLLWIFVYIRQIRLRNEQEKTSLQQQLLRSQMNPHFIFNALSSVQNSIITEKPALASKYLAKFSKLMRNILEGSSMELITLEQELVTIEHYLALQKIRFGEKFDFHLHLDERLDTETLLVPPMLAQPFIENAIEHGFRYRETKGMLHVRFRALADRIRIEIEDDGIGRKKAAEIYKRDKKDYKSMATNITLQRIKAMNRRKKRRITLQIIDLTDENGNATGTLVRFEVPV